jgi:hypothetical protein
MIFQTGIIPAFFALDARVTSPYIYTEFVVQYSLQAARLCTVRQAKLQLAVVLLLVLLYSIPRFAQARLVLQPVLSDNITATVSPYAATATADSSSGVVDDGSDIDGWVDDAQRSDGGNDVEWKLMPQYTSLGDDPVYWIVYDNILYTVVILALPLTALTALNVRLVRELRALRRKRAEMQGARRATAASSDVGVDAGQQRDARANHRRPGLHRLPDAGPGDPALLDAAGQLSAPLRWLPVLLRLRQQPAGRRQLGGQLSHLPAVQHEVSPRAASDGLSRRRRCRVGRCDLRWWIGVVTPTTAAWRRTVRMYTRRQRATCRRSVPPPPQPMLDRRQSTEWPPLRCT